jgi:hypothetical protein
MSEPTAIDHKGNRGGSAPDYLREAFHDYVSVWLQGQAPG